MDPHDTTRPTRPDIPHAPVPLTRTFGPQRPTLGDLSDAYLQDYQVRQFRSVSTARGRVAHLTAFFGRVVRAAALTTHQIRQYQLARRAAGAATGTINRETSALYRMCTLAVHWGWLDTVPHREAECAEAKGRRCGGSHALRPSAHVRSASSAGAPAPPCGPAGTCTTSATTADGRSGVPHSRRANIAGFCTSPRCASVTRQ